MVLEVLGRGVDGGPLVLAGMGGRAQWCRNVTADPRVRLWWGTRQPHPGRAERLSSEQAQDALASYAVEHPRAWNLLGGALERLSGGDDPPAFEVVPD